MKFSLTSPALILILLVEPGGILEMLLADAPTGNNSTEAGWRNPLDGRDSFFFQGNRRRFDLGRADRGFCDGGLF
jgi:hypothetical protein